MGALDLPFIALLCFTLLLPILPVAFSFRLDKPGFLEHGRDRFTNAEAGGEARRFDTDKVDEAGQVTPVFVCDDEVPGRFAWGMELWPDAGHVGLEVVLLKEGQ